MLTSPLVAEKGHWTMAKSGGDAKLSTTEREVLAGLRAGRTGRQISDALGMGQAEFVAVRRTTLRKLGAKNREQLMLLSKAISDD